mgnify:CR=1 FL=1
MQRKYSSKRLAQIDKVYIHTYIVSKLYSVLYCCAELAYILSMLYLFLQTEEDFRHVSVVTGTMKRIAWGIVILFNLFFLWYMMTMALTRARDFQVSFAIACTVQLFFEIFIFETLEVSWVQYVIPHLVVNDVRKRITSLRQQVRDAFDIKLSEIEHPLDATEYLFVSARLAKEFPTLFESEVILIFSNYLPGAMGERWNSSKWWRPANWQGAGFTIFLPMLLILQWMGTFSMRAQKAIIHVFQPIFCALGVLMAFFVAANPIWLLVPAAFVCFELYQWSKRKRKPKVNVLSEDVDMDAKVDAPMKVKPEPEVFKITDIDDHPLKAKPVETPVQPSTLSAVVAVREEPTLVPPVEKVESTESIPLQPPPKKKKAFANYEMQDEKKNSLSEAAGAEKSSPFVEEDDDDDDARTVYDDDGRPSGVKKVQKNAKKGGGGTGNTAARKKNRRDLKAQELFDQHEKRLQEEEKSGCQDGLSANSFENPPKALDPFRVSPLQRSLGQAGSTTDEVVPSPYLGKDIAPVGHRDMRPGRVHLPPVSRQGGPGSVAPNRFNCLESGNDETSSSDEEENIPKLKWEK